MRAKRRVPLRCVVVAGCLSALITGCGTEDPDRLAEDVAATQWPWEVHPPTSNPSPSESPPSQVVTPDDIDDESDDPDEGSDEPEEPEDSAESEASPTEEVATTARLEGEVITLSERLRADHGCDGELTVDDRLVTAARAHSTDMVERGYFAHESPDGEGPGDRAEAAGYPAWGGENIASGYTTAQDVVDAWMDSDGHRANLLNCGFAAIGVGAAEADDGTGYYWTQTFGWE